MGGKLPNKLSDALNDITIISFIAHKESFSYRKNILTLFLISRLIYHLIGIQLLEIFKTEYLRGLFKKINIIEDKIEETLEAILKLYLKINNESISICG